MTIGTKKYQSDKPRLAVLINPIKLEQDPHGSGFYKLHIVKVENEQPRNISHTCYPDVENRIFDDLTFRCYFSYRDGKWQADMFEYLYDGVGSVDTQRIETLVKGLKKCGKVYEALPMRPLTFGQYVSMMAHGLGVRDLIRQAPSEQRRNGREYSFYSDLVWQVLPLSHAQGIIDGELDATREKVLPTPTSVPQQRDDTCVLCDAGEAHEH